MIAKQSNTASEASPQALVGAFIDQEIMAKVLRTGGCPIYSCWAFQQVHGIGWGFAEYNRTNGE